jgi:hypothetical protein
MSEITRINRAARWLMELASELESIYNSSVGEKYKIMLLMLLKWIRLFLTW